MTDSTTPQDSAAMPPASDGSAVRCRPIGAYVHTPTHDDLLAEIARLRLTDAEREAVEKAAWYVEAMAGGDLAGTIPPALRGLLERLK